MAQRAWQRAGRETIQMNEENRLFCKLKEYCSSDAYPFHMPGHKRTDVMPHMKPFFEMDITEIDGFDNLHEAEGILKEIEVQAAELYGAREAIISVNGTTAGILAAILSQVPKGGSMVMGRGAHKSVYHGLYLQEVEPVYLQADSLSYGIPGDISPKQVAQAMDDNPLAKTVLLTSPTYEGLLLDIPAIAKEVHKRDGILLVDAAHGAHLGFTECMPKNPVNQGADLVVVSLHKTMPAMTQTSLVLVGSERVDAANLRRHMAIVQTSSPSYILMTSIQESILYARERGEEALSKMAKESKAITKRIHEACKHVLIVDGQRDLEEAKSWDPSKLLITTKNGELSGSEIYHFLRREHHLQLEMATSTYGLAMLSMMDDREAYERLEQALLDLDQKIEAGLVNKTNKTVDIKQRDRQKTLPDAALPLWKAFTAACKEEKLKESLGKVAGTFVGLYPPGIPILAPGERIGQEQMDELEECLACGFHVQGLTIKDGSYYLPIIQEL